jgi:hypothetical protein
VTRKHIIEYLASIGKKGGKVKSEAKKKASSESLKKARAKRWAKKVGEK